MIIVLLIIAAGIGVFYARHAGMMPEFPKDSEYDKHKEGDWTRYDVTPARAPRNIAFFFYIGVLGLILAAVMQFGLHSTAAAAILGGPIVAIAVWWGMLRDSRPKSFKSKSSFRVSPEGVDYQGRVFKADDIHRMVAPNGFSRDKVLVVTSHHSAATAQMALNHRAAVQEVCYGLAVEANGKSQLLCGGLTETTAFALLSEACRILGLELKD